MLPFAEPFTRADLAAAGIPVATLRSWLRSGLVKRLARGVYLRSDLSSPELSRSMLAGSRAISVLEAAKLHRISMPTFLADYVSTPVRVDRVPTFAITEMSGVTVPTAAWTAVQLARYQSLPNALIPLDSALRNGVPIEAITETALALQGRHGAAGLAFAVREADSKSESPLESYVRGRILQAHLPRPVLQQKFVAGGRSYRVDFFWPQQRLVLEADGVTKYQQMSDLHAEKRRQTDLENTGIEVWRCLWQDVRTDLFIRRLAARLN